MLADVAVLHLWQIVVVKRHLSPTADVVHLPQSPIADVMLLQLQSLTADVMLLQPQSLTADVARHRLLSLTADVAQHRLLLLAADVAVAEVF